MKKIIVTIMISLACILTFNSPMISAFPGGSQLMDQPREWDVLPNGLIILQYDRSGDGIPDYYTLHPVTWSGWTSQTGKELKEQACASQHWVFIVEYGHDRYAYFAQKMPVLFGDDPRQRGEWTAKRFQVSGKEGSGSTWKKAEKMEKRRCVKKTEMGG